MIKNQHIPIMSNEILSFIHNKKKLSILDCTFGGGGHSKKFLELGHHVTAFDQDKNSFRIAEKLKQKELSQMKSEEADLRNELSSKLETFDVDKSSEH